MVDIKEDQEHDGRTISQNGLVWREISCCGQLKTRQDGEGSSMAANPRSEDGEKTRQDKT